MHSNRTRDAIGRRKSEAGFTLIELMVVLAILTLVYAIVFPTVTMFFDRPRTERAGDALAVALTEARADAIARVQSRRFIVETGHRSWRYGDRRGAAPAGTILELTSAGAIGNGIVFYADGSSSGGHIMLRSGEAARIVTVDWLTGRATVAGVQ